MKHESVLLHEVISVLGLRSGEVVVDGTIGSGGHAEAILEETAPSGILIGIDQDSSAVQRTRERLKRFSSRVILRHANFRDLDCVLREVKISAVDAVLFDVGVSLEQLEEAGRGFSFRLSGPLDMRMNESGDMTAHDVIEKLTEKELKEIFLKYGEERRAGQVARWIVSERRLKPILTTDQLAELIKEKVPSKVRYGRIHPATRIFQALRIAVNDELGALKEGIDKALAVLKPGGRLAVITFHSLEDRIVKHSFLAAKKEMGMEILTKKPVVPGVAETERNWKSRSAKLRAIRRAA